MSQPSSNLEDQGVGFVETTDVSQPDEMDMAPPAPVYRKQGFNTYTVMLICAFVFLTAAAIVLFMEAAKY